MSKILVEFKIQASVTVKKAPEGLFVNIIPVENLNLNLEDEKLTLKQFEIYVKRLAAERIIEKYGPGALIEDIQLINKGK